MEISECIKTRRSVRKYKEQTICIKLLKEIIETALWAPSGKNKQPWKFYIIQDKELIANIASMTINGRWAKNATCYIAVFLDKCKSYDYIKDVQSIGAIIQTILLLAHSKGLGACWIGEILKNANRVIDTLNLDPEQLELMALITVGYPEGSTNNPGRINIDEVLLNKSTC